MNTSVVWLAIVGALTIGHPLVSAFSVGCPSAAARSSRTRLMSTPGGWENDDFLESLGGGGNYDPLNDGGYGGEPVERIVPENDLTDEEITMMAMRAAQFYNTDTSIEEAYGVERQGPPRKQEEDEGEFQ